MAQRVLVLGGGFGGMFAARRLSRLPRDQVCVELVDDNNYFVFQPLLPEVAAGTLNAADAVTPFRVLLPGVKVN
ncbi:MAG TPA: nucleotide-disulfide oxidoreductase, partial [Candidatus Omnitrophota bacterium]|nr:nucleotide-disulfide oxidoreductase [Candidatus Omnitrophota bacterium]